MAGNSPGGEYPDPCSACDGIPLVRDMSVFGGEMYFTVDGTVSCVTQADVMWFSKVGRIGRDLPLECIEN